MTDHYFDIQRLYPTLNALGFNQGKRMMQFWADHGARVARAKPESKSTVGENTDLPIYTLPWPWLRRYSEVNHKYQQLVRQRLGNPKALDTLKNLYAPLAMEKSVAPFNSWLTHGLMPQSYIQHHRLHQAQYIEVSAYPPEGLKVNDLLAALGKFSIYAFYKGVVINAQRLRVQSNAKHWTKLTSDVPDNFTQKINHIILKQPLISTLIVISHAGLYVGDIYEFNGKEYLGTWDINGHDVDYHTSDYLMPASDTEDPNELSITNATFRAWRQQTGRGRDFLALSPIDLIRYPVLIKLNQRGVYVP